MASSRLTTLQVHDRFKQNFNTLYPRQKIPEKELIDDSLTSLQWLQNLNVNPIPPLSNGNLDGAVRVNAACRRIRADRSFSVNRNKQKPDDATHAKADLGIPSANGAQSNPLNNRTKIGKMNSLPPLISQSRTPVLSQCRSRAGGHARASQKDTLPQLSGSNDSLTLNRRLCEKAILSSSSESAMVSDVASNQYVLSPRQMDRDLLPGQVDYKNNPYVKPPYTHLALIYEALRRSRRGRMTIQKICEWIKKNFIYYRFVRPDWQNSICDNLSRHKCFERVGRSAGKETYWRINPKFEEKFSDDALRRQRLASAGEEKGQSTSASEKSQGRELCSPTIEQVCDHFLRREDFLEDDDDPPDDRKSASSSKTSSANSSKKGSAGHKRKQINPRKRSNNKKSRRHCQPQQQSKIDPLLDQAPELGSLKGEFTFTNILEGLRLNGSYGGSSMNSSLSMPSTPTLGLRKNSATTASPATVTLPIDPSFVLTSTGGQLPDLGNSLLLPSPRGILDTVSGELLPDEFLRSENATLLSHESLGKRRSGNTLNTPTFELEAKGDHDLFSDVEALDLTVTGSKIEPPLNWTPDTSLDFILGERLDNFNLDGIDLGDDFFDLGNITGHGNSPRWEKANVERRPGFASSAAGPTMTTSPRRANHLTVTSQPMTSSRSSSLASWQELKTATDSVRSLLAASFEETT